MVTFEIRSWMQCNAMQWKVIDKYDLTSVMRVMGDDQGANDILRHNTTSIANDVSTSRIQTQQIFDVESGIHTSLDCDMLSRRNGLLTMMGRRMKAFTTGLALIVSKEHVS